MKITLFTLLCCLLVGCMNRDAAELKDYLEAQNERYTRYETGSVSEAKQALRDIIACAQEHRGKLRRFYGAEWETALCYGRLALIAEAEGDLPAATNYWVAAVDAQLLFQKDERAWTRSNPRVHVPDQDSDVYKSVTPDEIRGFLIGLETNTPIAWRSKR
jgi:hypothetical protein